VRGVGGKVNGCRRRFNFPGSDAKGKALVNHPVNLIIRGTLDLVEGALPLPGPGLEKWCQKWHHCYVASIEKIEQQARKSPENVSYSDMLKLCAHYFGEPRSGSGSHNAIFKMPWAGDPRINLQNKNGKAKPYQVKQAIAAIDRSKEK
jgi:hypothetical protein